MQKLSVSESFDEVESDIWEIGNLLKRDCGSQEIKCSQGSLLSAENTKAEACKVSPNLKTRDSRKVGPACDPAACLKILKEKNVASSPVVEHHQVPGQSRKMGEKRARDGEDTSSVPAPEPKKRKGFRVGPDNLPDGPWRRKG